MTTEFNRVNNLLENTQKNKAKKKLEIQFDFPIHQVKFGGHNH